MIPRIDVGGWKQKRGGPGMAEVVNVADLIDPNDPQKRTYKQVNAARGHTIALGSLVEIVADADDDRYNGVRLYVVLQGRDCDMTPLYWLAPDKRDTMRERPGFGNQKWIGGFAADSLRVIR